MGTQNFKRNFLEMTLGQRISLSFSSIISHTRMIHDRTLRVLSALYLYLSGDTSKLFPRIRYPQFSPGRGNLTKND